MYWPGVLGNSIQVLHMVSSVLHEYEPKRRVVSSAQTLVVNSKKIIKIDETFILVIVYMLIKYK